MKKAKMNSRLITYNGFANQREFLTIKQINEMNAEKYLESLGLENVIGEEFFNDDDKSWYTVQELLEEYHQYKLKNHVDLADVSGSASNVISKMKHLPESDYSLDGQLKLIRVCGNTLGLYKAVKWMQEHYR